MSKQLPILTLFLASAVLFAHPMGNFTVSHYTRFQVNANGVDAIYVLDLAEIPTGQLLSEWGLDRNSPLDALKKKAEEQAREWQNHLEITADGRAVTRKFLGADFAIADGAANLPVVRITSHFKLDPRTGKQIMYEDRNFPDRAGWKEIVIDAGKGATLVKASQGAQDRSKALTEYPQDPTVAPPQDVRAGFEWTALPLPVVAVQQAPQPPVIVPVPQPKSMPAPAPAASTPQGAQPGAVVKGDYLSRLLHQRDLSLGLILLAIAAAFGLGAAHALTPGHGKTIVAAYLVGSRGTIKHAAYLGAMVTFTHTVVVFLLGLATLFLFQYVMPEKITQGLGVISGLSIVALGGWMLYKRARGAGLAQGHHHHDHAHPHAIGPHHHEAHSHAADHHPALVLAHVHSHDGHAHTHPHEHDHPHAHEHVHAHAGGHQHEAHSHAPVLAHAHSHDLPQGHSHPHEHEHRHPHASDHEADAPVLAPVHSHEGHTHAHPHDHPHPHTHDHGHGKLVHSHGPGGHEHSHDVPDQISWGSLTALAISGGLVPCETALVLLLSAIALGRVGLGLLLLVAFSLGLAVVLMAIGAIIIYAKHLLPERDRSKPNWFVRWMPVASAAVVTIVGLLMTGVSLGWLQPGWMI